MENVVRTSLILSALAACVVSDASLASAQFPGTQRIVNGRPATQSEILATVGIGQTDLPGLFFCTGTLVAPDVVMTAAHCVEDIGEKTFKAPFEVDVVVGALKAAGPVPDVRRYEVSKIVGDCDYFATEPKPVDMSGIDDEGLDIAFLRLRRSVPPDVMKPVPILPEARIGELNRGTPVQAAGYGITENADDELSVLRVAETAIERLTKAEILTKRNVMGKQPGGCNGDSGGPLYYRDLSGDVFVIGATSRAPNDGLVQCGNGGIYVLALAKHDLFQRAQTNSAEARCPYMGSSPDNRLRELCMFQCADGGAYVGSAICSACSAMADAGTADGGVDAGNVTDTGAGGDAGAGGDGSAEGGGDSNGCSLYASSAHRGPWAAFVFLAVGLFLRRGSRRRES